VSRLIQVFLLAVCLFTGLFVFASNQQILSAYSFRTADTLSAGTNHTLDWVSFQPKQYLDDKHNIPISPNDRSPKSQEKEEKEHDTQETEQENPRFLDPFIMFRALVVPHELSVERCQCLEHKFWQRPPKIFYLLFHQWKSDL